MEPSDIRIEPPKPGAKVDTPPFFVAKFRITGATVFPEEELLGILGAAGEPLTLGQVQERADRLTKFYNSHGYSVARALVPAQDVREGIVDIRIIEGRYGRIEIRNATEISESRILALLDGVKEGALVHGPMLERGVLLVSDLAGVRPKATLEPGAATGLTDLVLELGTGKQVEHDITADNAGSRYTGRNRLTVGMAINSPADIGDRILGRFITSGHELASYRLGYELPVGGSGLRGGPYVARTTYTLGDTFADLDASGTANIFGGALVYPLIRSSVLNLRTTVSAEKRKLEDRVKATSTDFDRTAKVFQAALGGEMRDDLLGGAITSFQGQYTHGRLSLGSPEMSALDSLAAKVEGNYSKYSVNVFRVQGLNEDWRITMNYAGQWSNTNLDSSEKFSIGGLAGVRAYPPGEAAGGDIQLVQLELHYSGFPLGTGQFSPFVFYDAARSKINHNVFSGFAGDNTRKLSGYGVGTEWTVPGNLFVRTWYARKAGNEPALAEPDRKDRFWFQAGIFF